MVATARAAEMRVAEMVGVETVAAETVGAVAAAHGRTRSRQQCQGTRLRRLSSRLARRRGPGRCKS